MLFSYEQQVEGIDPQDFPPMSYDLDVLVSPSYPVRIDAYFGPHDTAADISPIGSLRGVLDNVDILLVEGEALEERHLNEKQQIAHGNRTYLDAYIRAIGRQGFSQRVASYYTAHVNELFGSRVIIGNAEPLAPDNQHTLALDPESFDDGETVDPITTIDELVASERDGYRAVTDFEDTREQAIIGHIGTAIDQVINGSHKLRKRAKREPVSVAWEMGGLHASLGWAIEQEFRSRDDEIEMVAHLGLPGTPKAVFGYLDMLRAAQVRGIELSDIDFLRRAIESKSYREAEAQYPRTAYYDILRTITPQIAEMSEDDVMKHVAQVLSNS